MNALIRGLPDKTHREIRKIAHIENLSTNQVFVQAVVFFLKKRKEEEEKDREQKKVFQRIREHREKMYLKYGLSSDSAKLIREDRDSH